ncbi:MAG: hypothetical protein PCFJNLEI_00075 [Verrucomicrobiae bacterium]|nr:hypothetical protein [Verrucomicrobiae bacterium]
MRYLLGLVAAVLFTPAVLGNNSWTGTVSRLYSNTATAWSLGSVPTAADDVFITNAISAFIIITNNMLTTTNATLVISNSVAGNVKHTLLLSNNVYRVTGATWLGSNSVVQFGIGTQGSVGTFSNGALTMVDNAALSFNSGTGVSTLNVAGEFVNGAETYITNGAASGFARLLLASGSSSRQVTNAGTIRFLLSNAGAAGDTGLVVQVGTGAGGLNAFYNTGTIHTFVAGGVANNTRVAVFSNQLVNAGLVTISNATTAVGVTNILSVTGSGAGAAVTNNSAGTIYLVNTSSSGGLRNWLTTAGDVINAGQLVGESTSAVGTNQVTAGAFRNDGTVVATNTGVFVVAATGIVNDGLMLATNAARLVLAGPVSGAGLFRAGPGAALVFNEGVTLDIGAQLAFAGGLVVVRNGLTNTQAGVTSLNGTLVVGNGAFVNTASDDVWIGGVGALQLDSGAALTVTNAATTARLVVGATGLGTLTLNAGSTLAVDQLLVTNNVAGGVTNSHFNFNAGTLITSNAPTALAAQILVASNRSFTVGGQWVMLGGSNLVATTASSLSSFAIGAGGSIVVSNGAKLFNSTTGNASVGANGRILVDGPGSVFTNASNLNLTGNGARLDVLNSGQLVAKAVMLGSTAANTVTALVSGAGSVWSNYFANTQWYFQFGIDGGSGVIVSNGGVLFAGSVVNGGYLIGDRGDGAFTIVTGTDSVLRVTGDRSLQLGLGVNGASARSKLLIENGGAVFSTDTYMGRRAGANPLYGVNSNTITVTDPGSRWINTGMAFLGGESGNPAFSNNNYMQVIVTNGGLWQTGGILAGNGYTNTGTSTGPVNRYNSVTVTDAGSVVTNTGTFIIGMTNTIGNRLTIANGGAYIGIGAVTVGTGRSASNNSLQVIGGETVSVFSNVALLTIGALGGSQNSLTASNALLATGGLQVGSGSSNNAVAAQGAVLWNLRAGNIAVGNGLAQSNLFTLGSGVVVTNVRVTTVGANGATDNQLLVNAGAAYYGSNVVVGSAGAVGNSLLVSGGLLEANLLSNFFGSTGNTISNLAGTFQFTTNAPTVAPNGAGQIALTDGVISFRAITNANVYANWGGGNQLSNISFAGANAFRLNAASNTTLFGQSYTFDTGLGATNYARLEMVNGHTAYRNGGVTIGAGGQFLASNTVAAIAGNFTNNGLAEIVAATADFQSGLHVAGTLTLRSGVVTGAGAKTIAGTLRGTGSVVGNTTIAGNLTPGLSIGTLVFSNDLTLTGTYQAEFGDGGNDQLIVVGDLTLAGATLDLTAVGGVTGETYVIASYGNLFGTFSVTNGLPVGYTVDYDYNGNQIAVILIPEPGALALVVLGLVVLGIFCHFRRMRV